MSDREQRVTPLELFFDLVFVYALTQVTVLMSRDLTWRGIGHGMLVLAALWWAWTGYAWLTNALEPEEAKVRLGMFAAMAAMLRLCCARRPRGVRRLGRALRGRLPAGDPRDGPCLRQRRQGAPAGARWPTVVSVGTSPGPSRAGHGLIDMIEEYARQNGHADIIRESVDGMVGGRSAAVSGAPQAWYG